MAYSGLGLLVVLERVLRGCWVCRELQSRALEWRPLPWVSTPKTSSWSLASGSKLPFDREIGFLSGPLSASVVGGRQTLGRKLQVEGELGVEEAVPADLMRLAFCRLTFPHHRVN